MGLSVTHVLLLLAVVIVLFGRGKIPELMGELAKGIRSFRKGLAEDDAAAETGVAASESEKRRGPARSGVA